MASYWLSERVVSSAIRLSAASISTFFAAISSWVSASSLLISCNPLFNSVSSSERFIWYSFKESSCDCCSSLWRSSSSTLLPVSLDARSTLSLVPVSACTVICIIRNSISNAENIRRLLFFFISLSSFMDLSRLLFSSFIIDGILMKMQRKTTLLFQSQDCFSSLLVLYLN